jgi:hypothetical protein
MQLSSPSIPASPEPSNLPTTSQSGASGKGTPKAGGGSTWKETNAFLNLERKACVEMKEEEEYWADQEVGVTALISRIHTASDTFRALADGKRQFGKPEKHMTRNPSLQS